MALIQTVSANDLYHLACRMDRGHNFGYDGWRAIGDYLESLSDDLSEDVEIDIISICCDYNMEESIEDVFMEFSHEHGIDLPTMEDWQELGDEEKLGTIKDYLQDNTALVICEDDLIIWQDF